MQSGFASKAFVITAVVAGFLAFAAQGVGADLSLPIAGNLLGSVVDMAGVPQRGATVQLFNKYQRLVSKTSTSMDGRFAFAALPADLYSVRVSLASFLPATRDKVAVKAGLDSVLQIHLATLFSSIELKYTLPTAVMTDDWKWVLRSSPATRPITRILENRDKTASAAQLHPRIFSGTHAMLSVSGGDGGLIDSDSARPDLGTGFALSTNVFGKNQVQLGGGFGQNASLGPAAIGLCAIYSRKQDGGFGNPPEVTLTMSQLGRVGSPFPSTAFGSPAGAAEDSGSVLRTMSLSVYNVADPLDNVHLEYGITGESVDYLQHTSRVSPFARVTASAGTLGEVIASYSDGGRPDELVAHQRYQAAGEGDLSSTVSTLSRLPQISKRAGALELQRTQSYEAGFKKEAGSRTYAVSAFYENVSNGRINVAGDTSVLDTDDLLWDGTSTTSTYNIGSYKRNGLLASADQKLNGFLDMSVAYGRMGGFTRANSRDNWDAPGTLLDHTSHNVADLNMQLRARVSGTRIAASYGWVDGGAIVPAHAFTTQDTYILPGLNISVRQPLPSLFGLPGRLELTADLRNLLAQGYLPSDNGSGRTFLVVQTPRAVRGGLNFIF